MYGVSTVVIVILILMISVSLAVLSYMFFSKIFTTLTASGTSSITQTTESMLALMRIESLSGNKVYVRNIGKSPLTGFSIFVNDKPVNFTSGGGSNPGEVAELTLGYCDCTTNNKIKITTAEGAITEKNTGFICYPETVLCLGFDEGTGVAAYDSSNYKNNGELWYGQTSMCFDGDCPTWTDGIKNGALKISIYDSVNVSNTTSILVIPNYLTVSTWIKIDGNNTNNAYNFRYILMRYGSSIFRLRNTSTDPSLQNVLSGVIYDPSGTSLECIGLTNLDFNRWYFLTMTYSTDDKYLRLYIDNMLDNECYFGFTAIRASLVSMVGIRIGYFTLPANLNSTIDEFRVLNRSLTLDEIRMLYRS